MQVPPDAQRDVTAQVKTKNGEGVEAKFTETRGMNGGSVKNLTEG